MNDIGKITYLLKQLSDNPQDFQELFDKIINQLSQEFAFVTKKNPESIAKKIRSLL